MTRFLSERFHFASLSSLIALICLLSIAAPASADDHRHIEYPTYFAHANGISIAYQDFGDPQDETILLVMGLGGQAISWNDEFVLSLVDEGYRVIRFDNRDIGLSEKLYNESTMGLMTLIRYKLGMSLAAPYLLDDMADDAIGLLDSLNISQAHVVGVSMGGMIGQIMTAKYPDRVSSLASIMSSSGAEHLPEGSVSVEPRDRDDLSRDEIFDDFVKILKALYGKDSGISDEEWKKSIARSYDRSHYDPGFNRQLWAIIDSGDRVELLNAIKQPVTVIHGTIDPLVPIEHGRHTAEMVSGSSFVEIDDLGHYMGKEHHSRVIQAIMDNVARVQ